METRLFVYGTLKRSYVGVFGREKRDRLHRESRFLSLATMPGRLHDIGSYPGVVDPISPADLVHGEVVELLDPAASLSWLDPYEGIFSGSGAQSEYRREKRQVQSPTEALSAWVYIYSWDVSTAPHIASGIWQP